MSTETESTETAKATDFGDEADPAKMAEAATQQASSSEEGEPKMSDEEVATALAALEGAAGNTTNEEGTTEGTTNEEGTTEGTTNEEGEDRMIPKSRFDEQLGIERERTRVAEQRARDAERGNAAPATDTSPTPAEQIKTADTAVKQARQEWQDALLDNDKDAANSARIRMEDAETTLDDLRMNHYSDVTRQETRDDVSYLSELTDLEKKYPVIDTTSSEYNQAMMTKMVRLHNAIIATGKTKTAALQEVAELYLEPLAAKARAETNGEIKEEGEETLRTTARTTLADSIKNQPADSSTVGPGRGSTESPLLRPSRMTRDQFDKLNDDQRALLRGDTV